MKQFNITILLTLLISMVGVKAFSSVIEVENVDGVKIKYRTINNDSELAVIHWSIDEWVTMEVYVGNIVIPEKVTYCGTTYLVTEIEDRAFYYCRKMKSITIPNSVTTIGRHVFYYCDGLTSITIPSSVKLVDYYAFWNCHNLTSITICSSGTKMREGVFDGCYRIQTIYCLDPVPPYLESFFSSDVYNYAILHVPVGSGEVYSTAFGWRNFKRIKEDLDISAVKYLAQEEVKVTGQNGEITISNINEPSEVSVYAIDGRRVGYIPEASGTVTLQVASGQLYVVKVGGRTYKVAL